MAGQSWVHQLGLPYPSSVRFPFPSSPVLSPNPLLTTLLSLWLCCITPPAVACAERGLKAHLVLRGEPPKVPTGNALVSHIFICPRYVSRAEYADREKALLSRAVAVAGEEGTVQWGAGPAMSSMTNGMSAVGGATSAAQSATSGLSDTSAGMYESVEGHPRVAIIPEGGSDGLALLGLLRLVHLLAERDRQQERDRANPSWVKHHPGDSQHEAGQDDRRVEQRRRVVVVDSGTGTTAVGCALAVHMLGLPWLVVGVTLAGTHALPVPLRPTLPSPLPLASLPWLVVGVTLAGTTDYYHAQQQKLLRSFADQLPSMLSQSEAPVPVTDRGQEEEFDRTSTDAVKAAEAAEAAEEVERAQQQLSACAGALPLVWVPRETPRRFGKVLPGEISLCCEFMRATGMPIDPSYTLPAFFLFPTSHAALASFGKVLPGEISQCCEFMRATGIPIDPIYTVAAWEVAHALPRAITLTQALGQANGGETRGQGLADEGDAGKPSESSQAQPEEEQKQCSSNQGRSKQFAETLARAMLPKLRDWFGSGHVMGNSGERERSGAISTSDVRANATAAADAHDSGTISITVLHTGGTLDMFGLAQRFPDEFSPKD
ncbi:unnamed protein product [Closterium sp. Naga37s-1]|nr:unnamed protein product [Closterium sp. Naga37s-1]